MRRKFTVRIQDQSIEEKAGQARQKAEPIESAPRESEDHLQLAYDSLEAVTEGTEALIAVVDPQLRYTFFNRVYQEEIRHLTGKYPRVGDSIEELFAHMPEQREVAIREWTRTLQGESRNYRIEFGDPARHRRIYSVRHTPVRDAAGHVVGAGEVAFDVSERVRIDHALHESEERVRMISDNIPGGATYQNVTQPDGTVRFTYISAGVERLLGLTPESVMADPTAFLELVVGEDRSRVASAEQEALRDATPFDCEFRCRTAGGDIKWIHCRSTAHRREDGSILWNGVIIDITGRKQAEEELRRSEALYRAIGESIDYGVWVCAPDGRNTYASDSFLKLVGFTQEQCSNFGWGAVLHTEDAERTIAAWKECCRTGGIWDIEHRYRGVDGQYHAILARGVPVKNERGEVVCWAGINLDISRLKRAQEETRASEARFRLLSDTAGRLLAAQDPQDAVNQLCCDVMAHLDCQVFLNYLAENGPDTAACTGQTGDEGRPQTGSMNVGSQSATDSSAAAGAHRDGVGSGLIPRMHLSACAGISDEEARQIEWLDFGEAVCGCMAQAGQRIVAEDIRHSEDPRTTRVQGYGVQAYCCYPLMAQGCIIGTLAFGTTTRPRFAAEEIELMRTIADQVAVAMQRVRTLNALEAARAEAVNENNRLATVMETLPAGVAILDVHGGIVRANPTFEQLWGKPRPLARHVKDYTAYQAWWADTGKPVQPEEWASARAIQRGETVVNQELQIQRFDGTRAFVLNSAAPIRDSTGRILGCAVAILDITERKRAEEYNHRLELQMQQAQKDESLGVLAGGIAHDFNNLLTAVVGNVGLASENMPADSPARQLLGRAMEASCQAADLCQQMLAYAGKAPLAFGPVQLNRLLKDMDRLIATSLSKCAQLRWNLTDPLPLVNGDLTRLRQIIVNLVINASEATVDQSGYITLATGSAHCTPENLQSPWLQERLPAGDYVFLEVADTGCGIEASTLSRVFEPFFTTKFLGRGLGLAAVLGIVRSHHGTIQVQSTPGRGSAFRVWLPVVGAELAAPAPAAAPAQDWRGSGTILLVDDEECIRSIAKLLLERLGFESVTAANGLEALEIYRADPERIWCVLLDATMPQLDGEATFRELVRIRENVRVVLSSGYAKDDIMSRFAGRGFAGFLQKPYTLQSLAAVLRSLDDSPP